MYKNVTFFFKFLFSNLNDFSQKFNILHKKGCKFQPMAVGCLMDPKGPKGKDQKKGEKKKKQTNIHHVDLI